MEVVSGKRTGHVLYASDDRGFLQLAVAVHSLLAHADPARPLKVSVFTGCGALSGEHRRQLVDLAVPFPFARVEIIDIDGLLERHREAFADSGTQWGPMMWARCMIGEIFRDEDGSVVYLDIDTLACRDLGELYDLDMSDGGDGRPLVLGAVCEECRESGAAHDPIWTSPLFDARADRYFNSGFLVMNVAAFREERLLERIVTWYAAHKREVWRPDQDALNCLFWDRTRFLHPRYNHCDGWLERQLKEDIRARHWRGNAPREVLEAILEPAVLHFWGGRKPWRWNHRPEGLRYEREMRAAGLLEDELPGTTWMRRMVGLAFRAYHALLRRQAVARLNRMRAPVVR